VAAGFVGGLAIRLMLLPARDVTGDIDVFVNWVRGIAQGGLAHAYDQHLSFPPVMAYIWGLLAAVEPGFRTAADSADLTIRVLMKLPPTLADFGLAVLVGYALRDRPRWAVTGSVACLLHPAVFYVSAWWGQYESIYVVFALGATVVAINGRNGWAAALIALSLMTKPQALPMVVPFAAWFWATGGWRGLVRTGAIGAAVIVVLWLPFLAADGPSNYLRGVAEYQNEKYAALSIWGWNVWWLVQEAAAPGKFVSDSVTIIGPVTLRHLGLAVTALLELVVALAVIRDPRPKTLIVALAASVLVAFSFLTTMHERYSYAALVFLLLLIPDPRWRWLSLAFGIVLTVNLLTAAPATPEIHSLVRATDLPGIVGSIAMLAVTGVVYAALPRRERWAGQSADASGQNGAAGTPV
jgi:Gpi18-like mannosyltransferase